MVAASIFTSFWENLEQHHEQGVFLVLVGLILSFGFIRMSTRIIRSEAISWWPGNIESEAGVHVHHLVFGIVAMIAAGTLAFVADGRSPFFELTAFAFGVGVGLTIDEFALWVHLEDVYWAEQGRSSVDAAVITATLMLLVMLGVSPATIESGSAGAVISSLISIALLFLCVGICFAKGRVLHGILGIFISPLAIYAALRLGKPDSTWARRRYGERRPKKQAKAVERFRPDRRTERLKEAFRDIVGGKPSAGLQKVGDEVGAATREATDEVRKRAGEVTRGGD